MRTQPRHDSRRRVARLGLPLLVAASLLAPLSVDTVQAATLSIGIQGEPASLDTARIGGSTWENDVLGDLFEGLVTLDPAGEYVPGVASDW